MFQGDEHSCYLFDCGNPSVCVFTTHPDFTSLKLPHHSNTNPQDTHEDDLANLAKDTTMPTSSTSTTTLVPPIKEDTGVCT